MTQLVKKPFFCFVTVLVFSLNSVAKLNVITSIPDIADIVMNIGGDSVSVFSLAQGNEDYHIVWAKSSFLPKINRADLVMSLGLEAEIFWLSPLVSSSRNHNVKQGNPGWIEVYRGLDILERPSDTTTVASHLGAHRLGNPHYNNGPNCGKTMTKNIYEAFVKFDGKNARYYEERYNAYVQKLDAMEKELLIKGAILNGVHVISYHADMAYFCRFYGMVVTGCLEPTPGIPPESKHLAQLVEKGKREDVKLVLYHQAQPARLPQRIAELTHAESACFANMVKSRKNVQTYIQLQQYNLGVMLEAMGKVKNR